MSQRKRTRNEDKHAAELATGEKHVDIFGGKSAHVPTEDIFAQAARVFALDDQKQKEQDKPSGRGGNAKKRSRGGGRGSHSTANRIPLAKVRANEILSRTEYMRVVKVNAAENKITYEVLRGAKPDDVWEVERPYPLQVHSADYVERTEYVNQTEMARALMACKDECFTVKFRPILTEKRLAERLKELHAHIKEAKTDTEFTKLAKQLLEVPSRTIKGRLLNPDTALGYSLVDDLEQPDAQEVEPRNVDHKGLLELTTKNIHYFLK